MLHKVELSYTKEEILKAQERDIIWKLRKEWNEYIKIKKGEQMKYERNIVEKSKDHLILFYKFIKDKTSDKD